MSRRRGQYDPLQKVSHVMWLVIKDAGTNEVYSCRRLEAGSDLKAELAAERLKHVDGGWEADPLTRYSFVHCKKEGQPRILITIQTLHPDEPTVGHGTYLGGPAPCR